MSEPGPDYQALMATLESLKSYRIARRRIDVEKELMGFGGYSDVRLALLYGPFQWFGTGERVAVKQLRATGSMGQRTHMIFGFVRELAVWAKLKHKNVLPLIGFYLDDDMETAWLLSPYKERGNIREYLDREKPDMDARMQLAKDSAEGLKYLHDEGVCHGDIKAGNVLVTTHLDPRGDTLSRACAILCDFGLAKIMQDGPSGLTTSKGLKGSTRYLAPELVKVYPPIRTFESDIWAWACLLVEILLNLIPYHDEPTEAYVMVKILAGEPPAPVSALDIPNHTKDLLAQCWSPQPELRPTIGLCLVDLTYDPAKRPDFLSTYRTSGHGWQALFAPEAEKQLDIHLERTIQCSSVYSLRFSSDGTCLAMSHASNIKLYDVETGGHMGSLRSNGRYIWKLSSFSPDGKLLVAMATLFLGNTSPLIRVWDIASRNILLSIPGGLHVSFSPDNTYMVYSKIFGEIHVYERASAVYRSVHALSSPRDSISRLAISPDSLHIAAGYEDRSIRIADSTSGILLATLAGYNDWVDGRAYFPDGRSVVGYSNVHPVKLWDIADIDWSRRQAPPRMSERTFLGHKGLIRSVEVSPNAACIVSSSDDGDIRFWDVASGRTLMVLRHFEWIRRADDYGISGASWIAVSPVQTESGWLMASESPVGVRLWRCKSVEHK